MVLDRPDRFSQNLDEWTALFDDILAPPGRVHTLLKFWAGEPIQHVMPALQAKILESLRHLSLVAPTQDKSSATDQGPNVKICGRVTGQRKPRDGPRGQAVGVSQAVSQLNHMSTATQVPRHGSQPSARQPELGAIDERVFQAPVHGGGPESPVRCLLAEPAGLQ